MLSQNDAGDGGDGSDGAGDRPDIITKSSGVCWNEDLIA
jgi:hypothetical protein